MGESTWWMSGPPPDTPTGKHELFGSADLRLTQSASVGFFADYTMLAGQGLPEVPEWNLGSRPLGFSAGDSYTIPPGHDAWVEGTERFVGIEVVSAEQYAKSGTR